MPQLYQIVITSYPSGKKYKHCSLYERDNLSIVCKLCHRTYPDIHRRRYALDCVSDTGSSWPDFIMTTGPMFDCVSAKIVQSLTTHNLKGWNAVPVQIPEFTLSGEQMEKHLHDRLRKGHELPDLHVLHTLHYGKLDLESSGLESCTVCKECGMITANYREPERLVIDQSTFDWDASDFFHFIPCGQPQLFVTQRVVEVARSERWTGVYFEPLGIPFNLMSRYRSRIDPLSKQWPPKENWD